jgi:hypothetical protein
LRLKFVRDARRKRVEAPLSIRDLIAEFVGTTCRRKRKTRTKFTLKSFRLLHNLGIYRTHRTSPRVDVTITVSTTMTIIDQILLESGPRFDGDLDVSRS